jgi:hypothetical protein
MNTPDEMSVTDVAIFLHRSPAQVRGLLYSGAFGPVRTGGTPRQKMFFVLRAGVEGYQREFEKPAAK